MKKKDYGILPTLLILFCLNSGSIYADQIEFSTEEMRRIIAGDVISKEIPNNDIPGKTFQAAGLINASVSNVFQILTDYEKYNEFMPSNDSTIVLERMEQTAVIEITLGLPLKQYKKYRLSMLMEYDENIAKVKWKKIDWPGLNPKETIKDTNGFWMITAFPDKAGHVLVVYHVYTDPGPIPFVFQWIADWLAERSVPQMITVTRDRVSILHPQ